MEKRLDKIEAKVDSISSAISSINSTLTAQHVSLSEHIRRTTLIEEQLMPIKTQSDMIKGAIKLIVLAGIIVGIVEGIRALVHP